MRAFFVEHLLQHKQVSPQTVAAYRDVFRRLFAYLQQHQHRPPTSVRLDDLDAPILLAFLDHLEQQRHNGVRTRNARLTALRSFFRFVAFRVPDAVDLVTRVLAIPTKRTTHPLVAFLAREEMDAILGACQQATWAGRRDHVLLLTLYNTGARVSEAIAVQREDVRFGPTSFLRLHGKGRKERAVPLWTRTAQRLQTWFRELDAGPRSAIAFPNARGARLTRHGVAYRLHQTVRRAERSCPSLVGRRVSPHVLRHTTAMHLLQAGVDVATIALWLGHEQLDTTHGYVEADLAMKERALHALAPLDTTSPRFKADDPLLAFLKTL